MQSRANFNVPRESALIKIKIWDEQRKLQSGLCYLSILSRGDERLYLTYHPGIGKLTAEPKKSPDCFTQASFRIISAFYDWLKRRHCYQLAKLFENHF